MLTTVKLQDGPCVGYLVRNVDTRAKFLRVFPDNTTDTYLYSLTDNGWAYNTSPDDAHMCPGHAHYAAPDVAMELDYSHIEQRIMQQMNEDAALPTIEQLEARVKDLTCSLSKQTRKNHALNEAIGFMANKNSGLRHRIKTLQKYIAKLKADGVGAPVEVREVVRYVPSVSWADFFTAVLFFLFAGTAVYGIFASIRDIFL